MSPDPNPDRTLHGEPSYWTNFRSPAALSRFYLTTALGLSVDLWTKVWAFRELAGAKAVGADGRVRFTDGPTYEFLPGWLHFQITANHGAVFGIGQGQRPLFVVVSVAAILFLTYLFATSNRRAWFYQLVLGMLLAGVLGNMYDRIKFGYVRDMIYALPKKRWPGFVTDNLPFAWAQGEIFPWIFNVADTLLCVGVGLMLCYSLFAAPKTSGEKEKPNALAPVKS